MPHAPFHVRAGERRAPFVFTVEHASAAVPDEYAGLGLGSAALADHVAWDIGAAALARALAAAFAAPVVESGCSRLVVDCNRGLDDHDLIVEETHGVVVPGNRALDAAARADRVARWHAPYHAAIDEVLGARCDATILVSIHSFTPELRGRRRALEVGVLYDDHVGLAGALAGALAATGLVVRHNEPYSGLDGLIYSARVHGARHALRYVELEVNNGLLRDDAGVAAVAAKVAAGLRSLLR
ncbi:MAG: N-formylglutamate amidohydrolase [Deltaproteobacteria bacterium]|nr:N-formylglutamate amidohydrolase [Deltaproteobacteria bacterium]